MIEKGDYIHDHTCSFRQNSLLFSSFENSKLFCRVRKLCQRGSNFDKVFLLMRVGMIQIPLYASHHRPASETPRADDGPTLNAGSVAL